MATDHNFKVKNGLSVGDTEVIDSSRNLTNINKLNFTSANSNVQGIYLSDQHRIYWNSQRVLEGNGSNLQVGEGLTGSINIQADAGLAMNGTTVIDSTRNLKNIGYVETDDYIQLGLGTTYRQTSDYLYIGGSDLAGSDAAIYIGNAGNGTGYGWRFYYHGTGSGNSNDLSIQSENLGSPVNAIRINQNGTITFPGSIYFQDYAYFDVAGQNFVLQSDTNNRNTFEWQQGTTRRWTLDLQADSDLNFVPNGSYKLLYNNNEILSSGQDASIGSISTTGPITLTGSTANQALLGTFFDLETYTSGTVPLTVPVLQFKTGGKTGWGVGDELGSIDWYVGDGSGIGARTAARIVAENNNGNGSTTTTFEGELAFYTSDYNTALNSTPALLLDGGNNAAFAGEVTATHLRLTSSGDAAPSSTTHAFQVGSSSGGNVIIDENEIMARNNGSASDLHLNADGGNITFRNNSTGTVNLVMSGTAFMDHSRNFTNIGTISSGAITSSGNITSTGGNIQASGSGAYIQATSLILENQELTNMTTAYQMVFDANDSDSDVPGHGNHASSYPFGVYILGDNGGTTTTLGSGLVKLWHTGHFSKDHIDYFVGLYDTGVTTTEFDKLDGLTATTTELNYVDGVTSNIQTQLGNKRKDVGYELGNSVDLDTIIETGLYAQNSNSDASGGSNYPVSLAGILEVKKDPGNEYHTSQTYYQYNNAAGDNRIYSRYRYDNSGASSTGGWSDWVRLLKDDDTFSNSGGDVTVSGTYDALVLTVANDSHTHAFNNLTSKTSGSGDYKTTGKFRSSDNIVSGEGSGGVALTINDGKGNANVTWNHENGVPEQDGNAARIEVNTDSSTGAHMYFELKSGVTDGVGVNLTNIMSLDESGLNMDSGMAIHINGTEVIDSSRNLTNIGTIYSGTIETGSGTGGALALTDYYSPSTGDHIANIGWLYSSGGAYIGYGVKQSGSGTWQSTYDNFNGKRNYVSFDEDSVRMVYAAAQQTTVGSAVTGLSEKFKFDLAGGTFAVGGTTILDATRNLTNIGVITAAGDITLGSSNDAARYLVIDKATTGTNGILLKNGGNNKVKLLQNASEFFELHTNNALALTVDEDFVATFEGNIVRNGTGANSTYNTDELVMSGYGLMGNRSANVYITNSNSSGGVQLGVGGAHNANPKFTVTSSLNTSHQALTVSGTMSSTSVDTGGITASSTLVMENNAAIHLQDENGSIRGYLQGYASGPHFRISTSNGEAIGFYDSSTLNVQIAGNGDFNLVTGDLQIGGTNVITTSRAITNVTTLSAQGISIDYSGTPTLNINDTSNAGGGGASGIINFSNTGGQAIGIGYTGDVTSHSDLIISCNASSVWGGYLGLDAAAISDATSDIYLDPKTQVHVTGRGMTFGEPGNGQNTWGRWLSLEGNAHTDGEGSGRIFFTEHNSTTASMSKYGMSIGYRGGLTTITGTDGNDWTGLSQIGNGEWGMWGHDNNATGALIMYGDRAATWIDFAGNSLQGVGHLTLGDSKNIALYSSDAVNSTNRIDLPRSGAITFYGNNALEHSICSRNHVGNATDDLRINSYAAVYINLDSNSNNTSTADFVIGRHGSGTGTMSNLFSVSGETGNVVALGNVTAYGSPSDIRLKENIEKIPNALDKVKKLDGVTFNYKEGGGRSTGLIAQQLLEVLPEVVYETKDLHTKEEHYAVRYGNVVGLLVESIKEQQEKIEKLEELVQKLISEK